MNVLDFTQKSIDNGPDEIVDFIYKYGRNRKHVYTKRSCEFCGIKFYRNKNKTGNFCSRSCGSKHHIKIGTFDSWRHRVQESKGQIIGCGMCYNMMFVKPHDLVEGYKHFCSKKCNGKNTSFIFSNGNHPNQGKKASQESKNKKKETLMKSYGVDNAYKLAKIRKVSNPQKEIFGFLKEKLNINLIEEQYLNGHYLDIFIKDYNIVVEYNGDYWHCNPKTYKSYYYNAKKQKFAYEIWEKDYNRVKTLKKLGYTVIEVWELEYKKEKEKTLEILLEKINNIKYNIGKGEL